MQVPFIWFVSRCAGDAASRKLGARGSRAHAERSDGENLNLRDYGLIPAYCLEMEGAPRYLLGKDEDSNVYSVRTASPYMIVRFAAPSLAPNPTRAFVWPCASLGNFEEMQFLVAEHYRHFSQTIFHLSAEKTVFEIIPFAVGLDGGLAVEQSEFLPRFVVCTAALNEGTPWVLAPEFGTLWEVSRDVCPGTRLVRELKLWESGRGFPGELIARAAYAAATIS